MKKLISIMAAASMVASLSLTSFAADTTIKTEVKIDDANKENVTFEATDSGYTAGLTNENGQYTIVVVKNDAEGKATISTSSIEYINQGTSQNFNFVLKSTPADGDTYTVFLGGDKTAKTTAGTIVAKAEETAPSDKLTISGTVSGYGNVSFPTVKVTGVNGDFYATVKDDGTYSVEVTPGTYTLTATNSYCCSYTMNSIVVSDNSVVVNPVLYVGDLDSSTYIDMDDYNPILSNYYAVEGDDNWNELRNYDLDGSGYLDMDDYNPILTNYYMVETEDTWTNN